MGLHVVDGNKALEAVIPVLVGAIETTSMWVDPETFRRLPVWAPQTARGRPLYDATWTRRRTNTRRDTGITLDKEEGNVAAIDSLVAALGVGRPKPKNWTVCHIWGYDDPSFAQSSVIVGDPKYFSCVGNMIWLPTPLKGFTDAFDDVKAILRTCAFYLYGWVCEHPSVGEQAAKIRDGWIPDGYPTSWPSPSNPGARPVGTAPYSEDVAKKIATRKVKIAHELADETLTHYPRQSVRDVLDFWKIDLHN